MGDVIYLSRRNFLIGASAALVSTALPSLPETEQLNSILIEYPNDYLERLIHRIWVTPLKPGAAYRISVFFSKSDSPWHVDALNNTSWLWVPFHEERPLLSSKHYIRLSLDPLGEYRKATEHVPTEVGFIYEDKSSDGVWREYIETHQFPAKIRQRYSLRANG